MSMRKGQELYRDLYRNAVAPKRYFSSWILVPLVITMSLVGISLTAITTKYSGTIDVEVGTDGWSIKIDGSSSDNLLNKK